MEDILSHFGIASPLGQSREASLIDLGIAHLHLRAGASVVAIAPRNDRITHGVA